MAAGQDTKRRNGPVGTLVMKVPIGPQQWFAFYASSAALIGTPLVEIMCPCGGVIHHVSPERAIEIGTAAITAGTVARRK